MKMVLVISSLQGGGAERVMVAMADYWSGMGRDVTLITFDAETESPLYATGQRVRRICLDIQWRPGLLLHTFVQSVRLQVRLRQALKKIEPDVVISFLRPVIVRTYLAMIGTRIPLVVSERNDPNQEYDRWIWRFFRPRVQQRCAAIVAQSQYAAQALKHIDGDRVFVIPNPVISDVESESESESESEREETFPLPAVVAMGRLEAQKGFDVLLRAFAIVHERHPAWHLLIFGEGTLRGELEILCASLGLQEAVRLPGRTRRPLAALKRATIFALSSRYEGFPNVLGEAMACGTAVVATDCPGGVQDIVQHGENGILVKGIDGLAEGLLSVIEQDSLREQLGRNAAAVRERFGMDRVMAMWNGVIEGVLHGGSEKGAL